MKFSIIALLADLGDSSEGKMAADSIVNLEKEMTDMKRDFAQFQTEFMDVKRKYESYVERLDKDTKHVS